MMSLDNLALGLASNEELNRALQMEGLLLDTVSRFIEADHTLNEPPESHFLNIENENSNSHANANMDDSLIYDDIHVDVVFVGFPPSFIEMIRDRWISSLTREEHMKVFLIKDGASIVFDGNGVRYNFHVIDVAREVNEAIVGRMIELILPIPGNDKEEMKRAHVDTANYYINAWEMDDMLSSLATTIGGGEEITDEGAGPAATFYVLKPNLFKDDTNANMRRYGYVDGFSKKDLHSLLRSENGPAIKSAFMKASLHMQEIYPHLDSFRFRHKAEHEALSLSGYFMEALFVGDNAVHGYRGHTHADYDLRNQGHRERREQYSYSQNTLRGDIIANTREWAQKLMETREKSTFDLYNRVTNLMNEGAHRAAMLSSLNTVLMSDTETDKNSDDSGIPLKNVLCVGAGWLGNKRTMWIDLDTTASPPVDVYSQATTAPLAVHPLNHLSPEELEIEFQRVGAAYDTMDNTTVSAVLNKVHKALIRQKSKLDSLYSESQTGCDAKAKSILHLKNSMSRNPLITASKAHFSRSNVPTYDDWFGQLSQDVIRAVDGYGIDFNDNEDNEGIRKNNLPIHCGAMIIQRALVGAALAISDALMEEIMQKQIQSSPVESETVKENEKQLLQIMRFHLESMNWVLQSSGVLLEDPHGIHHHHTTGHTPAVDVYLGHISALLLRATRQFAGAGYNTAGILADVKHFKKREGETNYDVKDKNSVQGLRVSLWDLTRQSAHGSLLDRTAAHWHLSSIEEEYSTDNDMTGRDGDGDADMNVDDNIVSMSENDDQVSSRVALTHLGRASALAHRLGLQAAMRPSLWIPSKIEVVIYVVQMHKSYAPINIRGNALTAGGLDLSALNSGLAEMVLPGQELSVSIEHIEVGLTDEVSLELALYSCLRASMLVDDISLGRVEKKAHPHYSSHCLWEHLAQIDANPDGIYYNQFPKVGKNMHTLHVPVFLLSVDSEVPTLLEGRSLAALASHSSSSIDGVLVVQNRQLSVSAGRTCGGVDVQLLSRNPVAAMTRALAQVIWGLHAIDVSPRHSSSRQQDTSVLCGTSPSLSLFAGLHQGSPSASNFSTLEMESAWRGAITKAALFSNEVVSLFYLLADEGYLVNVSEYMTYMDDKYDESHPLDKALQYATGIYNKDDIDYSGDKTVDVKKRQPQQKQHQPMNGIPLAPPEAVRALANHARGLASDRDWAAAGAFSNAALALATQHYHILTRTVKLAILNEIEPVKDSWHRKQSHQNERLNSTFNQWEKWLSQLGYNFLVLLSVAFVSYNTTVFIVKMLSSKFKKKY
jgi:hypothetical protein